MTLTAGRREVIAMACKELLFGFASRGATEHAEISEVLVLKDLAKVIANIQKALEHRRTFCADNEMLSQDDVAKIFTRWMHDFIATELRSDQQAKKESQKTSIFSAWVRNTFGSKAFLCAILQNGFNIMPSGAPEHAPKFASEAARATHCLGEVLLWLAKFADDYTEHRNKQSSIEARKRSGTTFGESGLTREQRQARNRRDCAKRNLLWAKELQREVDAYWNRD